MRFTREMAIFSIITILSSTLIFGQETLENDSSVFAQIAVKDVSHNFGELSKGEKGEHLFEFKNKGNAPLIINNVLSTCGCTVPEWSREPIAADSTGVIKVVFDSTTKIGRQNKVITIRSNSKNGDFRLRISAMVLPPEK